jgi:quercetin dioxygenase-like cupin family protein
MEIFQQLSSAPMESVAPGIRRFVFTLEKLMGVYIEAEPGVQMAEHSHPHEQIGMIIRGKSLWRVGGKESILEAPAMYRLPSEELHAVEVLGDETAIFLDFFSPIREDFLQGVPPAYMKGSAPRDDA